MTPQQPEGGVLCAESMGYPTKKEELKVYNELITASDAHLELNRSDNVIPFIVKQTETIG